MRKGLQYGNDPAGAPRIAPNLMAGISDTVKIASWRWSLFLPSFFGFVAPSWLSDSFRYAWSWADTQLSAWEAAGYRYITVVLNCSHPVFCAPTYLAPGTTRPSSVASMPPKSAAAWAELDRWVRALLRRYRGRIAIVECESEWQNPYWWAGSLDDYLTWLRLLRRAIRDICPEVKLCLGGHTLNGLVDDAPDSATIEARIASLPEPLRSTMRRAIDIGTKALATGEFDVVEYHSLGQASGIVPAIELTRACLPPAWTGEIWIGDALPGTPVNPDPFTWSQGQPDIVTDLALNDPAAVATLEARQVTTTLAKIQAAYEAGCAGIHFGPLYDWQLLQSATALPWQGLTRSNGTLRPVCGVIRNA